MEYCVGVQPNRTLSELWNDFWGVAQTNHDNGLKKVLLALTSLFRKRR